MANTLKSRIPQLIKRIEAGIHEAAEDTGDFMTDVARETAPSLWNPGKGNVARGVLASGVHAITATRNDYDLAVAAAFMSAEHSYLLGENGQPVEEGYPRRLTMKEFEGRRPSPEAVPFKATVTLYAPMVYSHFVEFGGGPTNWGKYVGPQPFMGPAYDKGKVLFMQLIRKIFS